LNQQRRGREKNSPGRCVHCADLLSTKEGRRRLNRDKKKEGKEKNTPPLFSIFFCQGKKGKGKEKEGGEKKGGKEKEAFHHRIKNKKLIWKGARTSKQTPL